MTTNSNNLEPEFDALLKTHVQQRTRVADCQQFDPDLASAYLEQSLTQKALTSFEEHLSSCPSCRRHVVELARLLPSVPTVSAPVLARPSWQERVGAWLSGWRLGAVAGLGAVAATVLLVVVLTNQSAKDSSAPLIAAQQREIPTAPAPEQTVELRELADVSTPSATSTPEKLSADKEGKAKESAARSEAPASGQPASSVAAPPPPPLPAPMIAASETAARQDQAAPPSTAPGAAAVQNQLPPHRGQAPSGPEANQLQAERALEARQREAASASSADRMAAGQAVAKTAEASADRATEKSKKDEAETAEKKQAAPKPASRSALAKKAESAVAPRRTVAGKTFRQENGFWVDEALQSQRNLPMVSLTRESDEYKKTLQNLPALKPWFDLQPVLVVWQGKVYRVVNK